MTEQQDDTSTIEDPALRQAQGPAGGGSAQGSEGDRPAEAAQGEPAEGEPAQGEPAEGEPAEDEPGEAGDDALVAAVSRTPEELQSALEALLLVADEPISETVLATTLATPTEEVAAALAELVRFYDETGRGFELRKVAGGWRYYTREQHAELLSGYVLEGQHAKLSQAALETLAVIAYLQPVTRSRVSGVRGVSVDGVMRTLLSRDLITEIGAEDSGATLFATTDYFLERMGLQSLDDLPEIAPYLPEATELEAELGQLAVVPDPESDEPADDRGPTTVDAAPPAPEGGTEQAAEVADGPDLPDDVVSPDEGEGTGDVDATRDDAPSAADRGAAADPAGGPDPEEESRT